MSDFPGTLVSPNSVIVGSTDMCSLLGQLALLGNATLASAIWPVANTAYFIPVQIEVTLKVSKFAVRVGTQSGNCDVGIYNEEGTCLVSKGSTAVAAAGLQTFDLSASISRGSVSPVLTPGTYYLAMNCDNITAAFFRMNLANALSSRVCGVQTQAVGALALPATMAGGNSASAFMPGISISGNAVV